MCQTLMRLLSDTCANRAALSTRSPGDQTESQLLTQNRPRLCVTRLPAWKCIVSTVRRDARYYQITSLLLLFLYGAFWLRFDISLAQAAADQKIVQSRRAVEIETLNAQAEVEPLVALAAQLKALQTSGPGALQAYVRNVRLQLYAQAHQVILQEK